MWHRRTSPFLLGAASGVAIVVLLALAVVTDASDGFDGTVIDIIRASAAAGVLWPLRGITELGSTAAVTGVALLTIVVGLLIGPWRHGVAGALTIGLASIGNQAFKALVARARPDVLEPLVVEHGFSFPSGHAALGMVAYGVLAVLVARSRLSRRARLATIAALAVLVLLIGVSRIWLGVHYPTDVLAGWTAGAVIVLVYARLTRSVSPAPVEAAVAVGPEEPRSDPPGHG